MRHLMLFPLILTLIAAACASEGSPTEAIASYLTTQVTGDADKLVGLSCAAWEADAKAAAAAFQSVDARIEELKCQTAGKAGNDTLVTCSGTLVIQYRGEAPREQALPALMYRARKENGTWKMCGTQ